MPRSRSLVLGAAVGYTWPQLQPFVHTLRAASPGADIVLLTGRVDDALRTQLRAAGVRSISVEPIARRLPPYLSRKRFNPRWLGWLHRGYPRVFSRLPAPWDLRATAVVAAWFHHVACSRYFHYCRWLERHAADYDHVLLSDVRDVVFQADPFAAPPPRDRLWVFLEHAATHGSDPGNDLWVDMGFGAEGREALRGRRVTCSGVTLGGVEAMRHYLAAMTWEMARRTDRLAGYSGVDQGVHNWLWWTGRLPEAEARENFAGPVLTMHGLPAERLRFDSDDRLVDPTGRVIPVLHQYDRHPATEARLRPRLGLAPAGS
jgi:hypothetical protein